MREVEQNYIEQWTRLSAELVDWSRMPARTWVAEHPFDRWFESGRLSVTWNCVGRHLAQRGSQPAIHWEGEPGDRRSLTYGDLHAEVSALAGALAHRGVAPGDHVALHLGWLPETVVAMLACARIGAVHTIVSTTLHSDGLAERLAEVSPKVLITQDGAWRHGSILATKARADDALGAVRSVEQTVVILRTGHDIAWYEGDIWYHDLISEAGASSPPSADDSDVAADQPLMGCHLANRNGKPLSVELSAARLLVTATAVHHFGVGPSSVFWLPGDSSWPATAIHGVYGPLSAGSTIVMFEGTLDVPSTSRTWDIVDRYAVDAMTFSPSLARALREWKVEDCAVGTELPSLRRCIMVGESSDSELAQWVAEDFAGGPVSLADAWGQMQLGGMVQIVDPAQPGLPDPNLGIVGAEGDPVPDGSVGELVVRRPWPGMVVAVRGEGAQSLLDAHWSAGVDFYATGDNAIVNAGTLQFLGRRDRVTSISGQLVSLTEITSTLLEHPDVRDAYAFDYRTWSRGQAIAAAIVVDDAGSSDIERATLAAELLEHVREVLGGLERPRLVLFVDRLGDELPDEARTRALSVLAAGVKPNGDIAASVTWAQVVAIAGT